MRLVLFAMVAAIAGNARAEIVNYASVSDSGLRLENAIKASCGGPVFAAVKDDDAGRRINFMRGRTVVATMWRSPVHYGSWKTAGGFEVEMHAASTDADLVAIIACMTPFTSGDSRPALAGMTIYR